MKKKFTNIIGYLFQIYLILSVIAFIFFIRQYPRLSGMHIKKDEQQLLGTKEKPAEVLLKPSGKIEKKPQVTSPDQIRVEESTDPKIPVVAPMLIETPSEEVISTEQPSVDEGPVLTPSTAEEIVLPVEPKDDTFPSISVTEDVCQTVCLGNSLREKELTGRYYLEQFEPKRANLYFQTLVNCLPEKAEYNYLYGTALSWTYQIDLASDYLRKSVRLDPSSKNYRIQLANVYIVQRRYKDAEILLKKYPEDLYAKISLGELAYAKGCFKEAKHRFTSILKTNPGNFEARFGLAKAGAKLHEYCRARNLLCSLVQEKPQLYYVNPYLFNVQNYTTPSVHLFYDYRIADDHLRRESQALDRYKLFTNNLRLYFPFTEKYRFGIGGFNGYERYKRVQDPKLDIFLVDILGVEMFNEFKLAPEWSLNIFGRYKRAISDGTMTYAFKSTFRVEPGGQLTYDSPKHFLDLKAYQDSFIILSFAETTSALLTRSRFEGSYQYRFPFYSSSLIGNDTKYILYDDSINNKQVVETAYIRLGIPNLAEYFTIGYTFNYSAFDKVAQDYYSYDWELKNDFMIEYHPQWKSKTHLYLLYTHGLVDVKNLQLAFPGGDPLVPRAKYSTNFFKARLTHRITDKSFVELGSSYYFTTFPYEEAQVYGKIIYLF